LGGTVYDPSDPMGKCSFNILATFAEFEVDLLRSQAPPSGPCCSSSTKDGEHAVQATLADSFAKALTNAVGLRYSPAWGIWLATVGAGAVLVGTVAAIRRDGGFGSS
jgi:hypothetical protein